MRGPHLLASTHLYWRNAFVESLLATIICALVMGVVFLPWEIVRVLAKPLERILLCAPASDGKSIYSLIASINMREADAIPTIRLVKCDLSAIAPNARHVCENLEPQCVTLEGKNARLFAGDARGGLHTIHLQSNNKTRAFPGNLQASYLKRMDCTRDGRFLVVHSNEGLSSWNIDLKVEVVPSPRWTLLDGRIVCFSLSPDSEQAVFGRTSDSSEQQTDLFEVNIQNGESRLLFEKFGWRMVKLAISTNGRYMLGVEDSGEVVLLNRPSAYEQWHHCAIPGLCTGTSSVASFSPDSSLLITSDRDNHRLIAWDLDRKAMRNQFETQPTMVIGCDFLSESQIISWGLDTVLRVWNLDNVTLARQINLSR